jgi:type VI protein secretion system component VasF
MLSAADSRDLRVIRYELEDFLRRFPAHPQALLLRDDIMLALSYEEAPRKSIPTMAASRMPIWVMLSGLALLGAALYLVYRVIKHLHGF